jgi:hypothetical protein
VAKIHHFWNFDQNPLTPPQSKCFRSKDWRRIRVPALNQRWHWRLDEISRKFKLEPGPVDNFLVCHMPESESQSAGQSHFAKHTDPSQPLLPLESPWLAVRLNIYPNMWSAQAVSMSDNVNAAKFVSPSKRFQWNLVHFRVLIPLIIAKRKRSQKSYSKRYLRLQKVEFPWSESEESGFNHQEPPGLSWYCNGPTIALVLSFQAADIIESSAWIMTPGPNNWSILFSQRPFLADSRNPDRKPWFPGFPLWRIERLRSKMTERWIRPVRCTWVFQWFILTIKSSTWIRIILLRGWNLVS